MEPIINILICEPNSYFADGLIRGILIHAHARGLNTRITRDTLDKHDADIVFLAVEQDPVLFRHLISRRTGPAHQQIFLIKEKLQRRDKEQFAGISGFLYRHQRLEWACQLATVSLRQAGNLPATTQQQKTEQSLTVKETEVIRCLAQGLSPKEIGRKLEISEKTVSGHKRNAMAKLHMGRTPDFIYWMLRGGLDALPAHRLPPQLMSARPAFIPPRHDSFSLTTATQQKRIYAS
jgi:DNA-binding CsgD family transcriptional regulator